ncbi:hypothetical protein Ddye_017431 [Dipteronia dyeriana]|uniref:Uncharacterized protein n=1 Tax=Dipteronia dyeriana TaxID=168575 RepID=A0AAD9U8Q7_9ROSI|nr:hypothetical protein Ddye_017431 [Dipteronia dyeriana]
MEMGHDAFYVEKRSEQVRGKKRLVIDYKPLNLFLQDDKFPVPRANTLFSQIPGATIFSKFDLDQQSRLSPPDNQPQ